MLKVIQEKLKSERASFNYLSIPIACFKLYLFCVTHDYDFPTVISIQNTSVLKIIPSSLSSCGNECTNKIIRQVGFALYRKYIRLARLGCGFMISCKFVILV